MLDLLPDLTLETGILIAAGGTALIAILTVWTALAERDSLGPRARALKERRARMRSAALKPISRDKGRGKGVSLARFFVERFGLQKRDSDSTIRQKLVRAGMRSRDAVTIYLFAKVACPLLFATFGALALFGYTGFDIPFTTIVAGIGGAAILGFLAPSLYVTNAAIKRKKVLRNALPDALDLLVVCTEAGLSLDAAIARVSSELGKSAPEMGEELSIMSIELNFLPERRQAFQNLADRTDLEEIRAIVSTLIQAEKYGTSVAQALRVLSADFRTQRLLRAEEKAARLPATLTVPMVLFILPCLFVVLVGPGILRIIDSLSRL